MRGVSKEIRRCLDLARTKPNNIALWIGIFCALLSIAWDGLLVGLGSSVLVLPHP